MPGWKEPLLLDLFNAYSNAARFLRELIVSGDVEHSEPVDNCEAYFNALHPVSVHNVRERFRTLKMATDCMDTGTVLNF